MMKFFLITICTTLFSCKQEKVNEYTSILQTADEVQITYEIGERTPVISKKDKALLTALNEVFNGKKEACLCKHTGYMGIYSNQKPVLDIWFATSATGSNADCQYLIVKDKCFKLTYQLGRYLDEVYNEIK